MTLPIAVASLAPGKDGGAVAGVAGAADPNGASALAESLETPLPTKCSQVSAGESAARCCTSDVALSLLTPFET